MYEHLEQGGMQPKEEGPLDMRLGVSEKGKICKKCGLDLISCPGHFGYAKLCVPVFHVGYFKHVISVLQMTCKSCSRILLSPENRVKFAKLFRLYADRPLELKRVF
jgi:DNA-directed RNA polymerase III subunit RPC1